MGIAETARRLEGSLSETGRRALDLLLSDPQKMASYPAAHVAGLLGVHETTLNRLATQLGYTGYRQFRASLAQEGVAPVTSAARMGSRADSEYTLDALIADEVAAMQRVSRAVAQEEIDALAMRIIDARVIYLFGPPYAQSTIELLGRRLRRVGISSVILPTSGRLIAEHLTSLTGQDLVISFVFRRPDPKLARINAYAQSLGAATAVIADEEGLAFDPRPDQLIVAPRGPRANQRSLVVPMIIVYSLQFALFHIARDRTNEALHRLDDLARLVGDDEPSHWA
ncbi:MurR/RpiR family transcriptional regulator [Diaminobutyricimonas sp. TR449]|uniref:MurR/RpiR family transcriptional regulator n=1 Tax=Diaminobutyricimonas sp. TR449 TaxID=2708076 RepID=UPI0014206FE8|nr:MurR/RpiR family transcriptional regulator [Diaminobutyricimonas sp. TR449]